MMFLEYWVHQTLTLLSGLKTKTYSLYQQGTGLMARLLQSLKQKLTTISLTKLWLGTVQITIAAVQLLVPRLLINFYHLVVAGIQWLLRLRVKVYLKK